jgi:hypothetical protein
LRFQLTVRWLQAVLALGLCSTWTAAITVPDSPTPSAEEVAVYKAFMAYFAGRTPNADVANVTFPLDLPSSDQCLRGIKLEKRDRASTDVHRLPQEIIPASGRFTLVTIRPGSWDPKGPLGLLQVSEIAFDARHQYAFLVYNFHCGALCGEGARVVFKNLGGKWKHLRSCGNWVS